MTTLPVLRGAIVACFAFASPLLFAGELPVPAEATIVDQRPAAEQERTYPMGAVRSISNRLRVDRQIQGHGQVSSTTYQLTQGHAAREAFTSAREALQRDGGYPLFWCQGRDCGEASIWANTVFNIARLNGGDENQAFILLRRSADEADTLVALYSVTRGTGRGYLHIEEFVAASPLGTVLPTPGTLLRELRDTGKLDYPDLAEPQSEWVTLLGDSLKRNSTLRVTVSGEHAEAWREALVNAGVRSTRLESGDAATDGLHLELIR